MSAWFLDTSINDGCWTLFQDIIQATITPIIKTEEEEKIEYYVNKLL